MPTEIEAKFRADGPRPLETLRRASVLGPVTLGEARVVDERDRYLDTADGRLAAALWACRLRTRDGVTRLSLKGPAEEGTTPGLHRRPELEGPANDGLDPEGWPASDAKALLQQLTGGAPLAERFELVQRRTERPAALDGRRIGTLTLDEVEVRSGGQRHGAFRVVEVELEPGADRRDIALLDEIGVALGRIDGLVPEARTKLEHALELIGEP